MGTIRPEGVILCILLLTGVHGCEEDEETGIRCTPDDPCHDSCTQEYSSCTAECYGQPSGCDACEHAYDECLDNCGGSEGFQCEESNAETSMDFPQSPP